MDNAESIEKVNATRPPTPWETETRRRWARLSALIAETEQTLSATVSFDNRRALEASLHTLKRAALSVWIDARRIGAELPGALSDQSSNQSGALVEG
jgi:hypothetical protein